MQQVRSSSMASKTLHISFSLLLLLLLLQLHVSAGQDAVRSAYWFPGSGIEAKAIDSTLFTHLFCAFADLDASTNQVIDSPANSGPFSQFTQTVQLNNPNVKTLLSIGGGKANHADYASMASQESSRKSFIDSSISLARKYGFHGLDLDWEYPETAAQTANLKLLFNEWRTAMAADAQATGKPALLLTAAVFYKPKVNGVDYDIDSIENGLDWINLMAYEFYDPIRSSVTKSHAALYDPSGDDHISCDDGVADWIKAGLSPKKLVLGLPYFGFAWRLQDANNHGLEAPASGAVGADKGVMRFYEIKAFLNSATDVYDETIVTNYCYSGTTWIGYDGARTISTKASYAKQKGLLGYFAWHVAQDDDDWTLSKQAQKAWGA